MPKPPRVHPKQVVAPKSRLKYPHAIYAGNHWSLAVGLWDEERALLIRWNDDPNKPLGNPVSHGKPTWFVLPEELQEKALEIAQNGGSRTASEARNWLKNSGPDNWPYDPTEFQDL